MRIPPAAWNRVSTPTAAQPPVAGRGPEPPARWIGPSCQPRPGYGAAGVGDSHRARRRRAWAAVARATIGAAVLLAALGAGATLADPPGRLENVRLSDTANGSAVTTFVSSTQIIYLSFDYRETDGHELLVRLLDAAGNELFTASRTLSGAGSHSIPLNSIIAVDRLYDALDQDATDLILAIDDALARIDNPPVRYHYIQRALVHTNRMRAAVASLTGLNLPADAIASLDGVADRLEGTRDAGLAAAGAAEINEVIGHLQAMRAQSIDLIVALRRARSLSLGSHPFPPTVDCQPYLVNMSINGLLRESLEFAVGDPGRVADLRLTPGRPVIFPGVATLNATSIQATLLDARCEPVADGTVVSFQVEPVSLAVVAPLTATTAAGSATTILRATGAVGGEVRVTAEAGFARAVAVVRLEAPPRIVTLGASQRDLASGGETTLTVDVTDSTGHSAPEGTWVSFMVEPPDRGRVSPASVPTTRGRATAIFAAGPGTGPVTVRATAGGTASTVTIVVAPAVGPTAPAPFPTAAPTPGPSPLPPPSAPPGVQRPECPGRSEDVLCNGTLIARVYRDDTCNRRFDAAWDRWLAGVLVTLVFPNGYVESVATSSGGTAHFGGLTLARGETMRLSASLPSGDILCYNSYSEFKLDFGDFEPVGYVGASFRVR